MMTNKHIAPLLTGLLLAHSLIGQTDERAGVDPLTGDFHYNVPVLTVPAPEGAFNLSLNYDPNVLMLQDASWVGLGWHLSPGKISRNINVFPDDFQGENVHSVASNGGTYTLFTHDGKGHILAEWEQEYFVEDDKDENMYGSLYLGEVANTTFDEIEYPAMTGGASATQYESSLPGPFVEEQGGSTKRSPFYKGLTSNPGFHHAPVSDVHHRLPGGVNPNYVFAPTHIAFDDYMVQAPGINGSIKPYRPEVGNVSLNHAQGSANNFMRWDYFAPWLREGDADYDKMGFHYVFKHTYRAIP
ncbi:MAG: hypothetical protein AAGB22_02760 [Bacteroidota bacterium]